jgi:hypothetical protein
MQMVNQTLGVSRIEPAHLVYITCNSTAYECTDIYERNSAIRNTSFRPERIETAITPKATRLNFSELVTT